MKLVLSLSLALAISAIGSPAWSADADHQAHHPAGAASSPSVKAMPGKARIEAAPMDTQLKAMHEMHDKVMAAKTPAERDALMAEHMKVMQDGMSLMNGMSPAGTKTVMKGDMATQHRAMAGRMEMMLTMMQMMMDRLPATPAK